MEFKKASSYDINITHTINGGIIVKVGCATLCFSNAKDMMVAMEQFYADPQGIEKEYNNVSGPQEVACSDGEDRASTGPMVSGGNRLSRGPVNVEEAPDRRR